MALSKDVLNALLEKTATLLLARIEDGQASPADISNALRLLKDNDISVVVKDSDALQELNQRLAKRRIQPVTLDDAKEYDKEKAFN